MASGYGGYPELTAQDEHLLWECEGSLLKFAKVFLPERFRLPFSPYHEELCELLDDDNEHLVLVEAGREMAKTSFVSYALPLHDILFKKRTVMALVSCSSDQATLISEALRSTLRDNPLIRRLWGRMESNVYAKDFWVTSNGCCVLPRGADQKLRGVLYNHRRFQLISIDDFDDPTNIQSESIRKRRLKKVLADIKYAVDTEPGGNWKIVVAGTPLDGDSVVVNLRDMPGWKRIVLEACDDKFRSNWPAKFTEDYLREDYAGHQLKGTQDIFMQERRCILQDPKTQTFKRKYFQYYTESEYELNHDPRVESFVIVDACRSPSPRSAYSAILGWSINLHTRRFYLRDLIMERITTDELYRESFLMANRIGARFIGWLARGTEDFIKHPVLDYRIEHGYTQEMLWLPERGKKEDRVKALLPYYRGGYVLHNRLVSGPLEVQLLAFPYAKFWDCMDCASQLVPMLEQGGRYFVPKEEAQSDWSASVSDSEFDASYGPELPPLEYEEWATI